MSLAPSTLAIAGGSGYLGARLALAAAEAGWQVRVLSRSVGSWPAQQHPRIVQSAVDWRQPEALAEALKGVEALILLAASNEIDAAADPVCAVIDTSAQAMAWLRAAARAGVARLLHFSTIHVYGATRGVLSESSPLRPRHPYAETHLAAELFVQAAHRRRELDCTVVRLSNAVGAPAHPAISRWTLLVNDLARQAASTGTMLLRSDGLQARDFVSIGDVASAVLHLLPRRHAGGEAEVFNLGSGVSSTVWELAQRLRCRAERLWGTTLPLERLTPALDAKQGRFDLDISALRATGWAPSDTLDTELDATLEFCRQHFGARRQAGAA